MNFLFLPKSGTTPIDEALFKGMIAPVDFSVVYPGTLFDSKTGAGIIECDNAGYDYAIRFRATNVNKLGRLELEIIKHGNGADVLVDIRDDTFNPDGSSMGTLLKQILIPAEFLPTTKTYFTFPFDLTGITSDAYYWALINNAGDASNHFHLHSESSQDAVYPVYRRTSSSGAWAAQNAVHFKAYRGIAAGNARPKAYLYHSGMVIMERSSNGDLTAMYCYCENSEGEKQLAMKYAIDRSGAYMLRGYEV